MSRRVIIDELEFEVPFGKISAKTWHEETEECKRILALHGWMDNSGSFDNLMPKLKHEDGLYIVALDLPGHGKSSQLPLGCSYSDLNNVMEVRRCLLELKWIKPATKSKLDVDAGIPSSDNDWKKFTIIGHSLGAGLGLFYASLYPDDVEEVVLLDYLKPRTTTAEQLLQDTAKTIDQFIDTVRSQSLSSHEISNPTSPTNLSTRDPDKGHVTVSQEAAVLATIAAHEQLGTLSREEAMCLLRRSTVPINTPPNHVIYFRDLRLQSMLNLRENWEISKILFARVKCHVISILAKSGIYSNDEQFRDHMNEMEEFLKSRTKSCYVQWLEGDHYAHMNRPQQTAELINRFLEAPSSYKIST